jgi:lysophospholipase L1-like esterase
MTTHTTAVMKVYRFLAIATFNTTVLIGLLNLVLAGLFLIRDYSPPVDRRVSWYREKFADLNAYARISPADANKYLDEQDAMVSIGFQYEPWVQFRNPDFYGTFLRTDHRGFRRTKEPRSHGGKPIKIYVFGGSTTFGYGVPDDHTIPSYIQTILEQKYPNKSILVKNYGQGFYYSSQELLLFISQIKIGDIPDWAIFIDGGNDTAQLAKKRDEPYFTQTVKQLWDERRGASSNKAQKDLSWIPMVRLAEALSRRLFSKVASNNNPPNGSNAEAESDLQSNVDYIFTRYTANMRMIRSLCREYGIRCYFVWQPVPTYKYDRTLHRTFPYERGRAIEEYWSAIYSRMKTYREADFLYLGGMLEGVSEKVFVDDFHYNEVMNEKIATRICEVLQLD